MISLPNPDLGIAALKTQAAGNTKPGQLGQEQFLKLMVTQFRNQDPFKPMQNGDFLGQLAQFSTVSGIDKMSGSLSTLSDAMYASQALQASGMVGRTVLADGNQANLAPGQPLQGAVELPFNSNAARIRILDALGQPVREINLGARRSGTIQFEWDGTTANGQTAPPGRYQFTATANDGSNDVALNTLVRTRVQSVSLSPDGAGTRITTENGDEISLTKVKAIM